MPTTTYLLNTDVTGTSTTATDLLSGTAVSNAGPNGQVWVSGTQKAHKSDETHKLTFDSKFTLFGRESGITVVPADSNLVSGENALSAHGRVVFYGQVRPNEPLTLNVENSASNGASDITTYSIEVKTQ
jgi:hypothetical protein